MGWLWNGKCRSKARLDGKTVVITGCNTGIGKYTVLDLYSRGARVVMACRNIEKAEEARAWVIEQRAGQQGLGQLTVCHLDLSSLASVRKCAEKLLDEESHIHILINNAGVMMCPRSLTEDGYELQFATNHLGHFLFTLILLPKIISSAPARIVNVASMAHVLCKSMNYEDINYEKSYFSAQAYGRSKAANILFTRELAKRLTGTQVTVYSLHPGVVDTELSRHLDESVFWGAKWMFQNFGGFCIVLNVLGTQVTAYSLHPGVVDTELSRHLDESVFWGAKWMFQNFGGFFMKSPEQGAQTTLYCALEESLAEKSGLYYDDCQVAKPTKFASSDENASKLWDISLDMVQFTPPEPFGKSSNSS